MAEARITRIQTGAEQAAGTPGLAHHDDLHDRMQAAAARTQQLIAETQAGIDKSRANVEHLKRTGRFPA